MTPNTGIGDRMMSVALGSSRWIVLFLVVIGAAAGCASSLRSPAGGVDREAQLLPGRLWKVDGAWSDIDVDPRTGNLYGLRDISWDAQRGRFSAEICRIGNAGVVESTIRVGGELESPTKLCVCGLENGIRPDFAVYRIPGSLLHVFRSDGSLHWKVPARINNVRAADLNGDGIDELLVGSSTSGLVALGANGRELWHSDDSGYIGYTAYVPARRGEEGGVVVGDGEIFTLDHSGLPVGRMRSLAHCYRAVVRVTESGEFEAILASSHPPRMQAIGRDGERKWDIVAGDEQLRNANLSAIAASRDGCWIAMALKSGYVLIYDARTHARVAEGMTGLWYYPSLAWIEGPNGSGPCLVVASAGGVAAFKVPGGTLRIIGNDADGRGHTQRRAVEQTMLDRGAKCAITSKASVLDTPALARRG
jgi:hypothetical protein